MSEKSFDRQITNLMLTKWETTDKIQILDSNIRPVLVIKYNMGWVLETESMGFSELTLSNQRSLLKAAFKYVEYLNKISKSLEDLEEDTRYHVWYLDHDLKIHYFRKVIAKPIGFKRLVSVSMDCGIYDNKDYVEDYKLTADEIYLLPKEWKPLEFGGLGLTKCEVVK
jgi:hypothetical protein